MPVPFAEKNEWGINVFFVKENSKEFRYSFLAGPRQKKAIAFWSEPLLSRELKKNKEKIPNVFSTSPEMEFHSDFKASREGGLWKVRIRYWFPFADAKAGFGSRFKGRGIASRLELFCLLHMKKTLLLPGNALLFHHANRKGNSERSTQLEKRLGGFRKIATLEEEIQGIRKEIKRFYKEHGSPKTGSSHRAKPAKNKPGRFRPSGKP